MGAPATQLLLDGHQWADWDTLFGTADSRAVLLQVIPAALIALVDIQGVWQTLREARMGQPSIRREVTSLAAV